MTHPVERFVGLMSGTSLDGIDAILLALKGDDPRTLTWHVEAFRSTPWPEAMQAELRRAVIGAKTRDLAHLNVGLAEGFAHAVQALLAEADLAPDQVRAIGSHGQTVWHEPKGGLSQGGAPGEGVSQRGVTFQIGDPATLAERTHIDVISDFRARDVAAGGEGAPLVPWADWVLLHRPGEGRALQNLGGMGNVTWLPPDGDLLRVVAFDTGPGVALLDGAARRASEGAEPWDTDGRRARQGTVNSDLLAACLAHPFLAAPVPRSTGRETFGDPYLEAILQRHPPHTETDWNDLLATLTAFTAESVARSLRDHLPRGLIDAVVLSGGGARNPALVDAITQALDPLPVRTGADALGIDPDAREAAAFALLAWAHVHGVPGNLPQVTGAEGPRVLGSLTPKTKGTGRPLASTTSPSPRALPPRARRSEGPPTPRAQT